ncbi:hypothetical protein DPEC_G00225790 [Dallia pectoralis]|uniref:Uncharacterized protein n=1 Tax=Dallia pectoralis TaxID=75939 RepID=A0ACC2G0N0_DALPE|nr:hypothetical protein DPEC_G00225790 [Dallia pectoralis]
MKTDNGGRIYDLWDSLKGWKEKMPWVSWRSGCQRDVVEAARRNENLLYGNSKIMVFPDLSPLLYARRKAFNPLKRKLRQAGVKYGMFFPATIKVDT